MKRRVAALLTGAALIFAVVLAAAPRLHDYIHQGAGPDHECAVTIFASGKCDATLPDVMPSAQPLLTAHASLPVLAHQVVAAVPCSILEHAPPAAV